MVHACPYPVLLWWTEGAEVAFYPSQTWGLCATRSRGDSMALDEASSSCPSSCLVSPASGPSKASSGSRSTTYSYVRHLIRYPVRTASRLVPLQRHGHGIGSPAIALQANLSRCRCAKSAHHRKPSEVRLWVIAFVAGVLESPGESRTCWKSRSSTRDVRNEQAAPSRV